MRQIKFRAWDAENKKMYYNVERCYDTLRWYEGNVEINVDCFGQILQEGKKYKTMQSTGLWDRSGKKIYEGDIVCFESPEHRWEVYWKDDRWYLENTENQTDYDNGDYYRWDDIDWERTKVIGNIYQKPESRKGGKKCEVKNISKQAE